MAINKNSYSEDTQNIMDENIPERPMYMPETPLLTNIPSRRKEATSGPTS